MQFPEEKHPGKLPAAPKADCATVGDLVDSLKGPVSKELMGREGRRMSGKKK